MNRRTFIGLLGSAIAATATSDEFFALARETVTPRGGARFVDQFAIFRAPEAGLYTVLRVGGRWPLLELWVAKDCGHGWISMPGYELVLRPNEPMFEICGPAVPDWAMTWSDSQGNRFTTVSRNGKIETIPLEVTSPP